MSASASHKMSTMAAQGSATVKLVGDASQLKLKAADGTLVFNEVFSAGAVPDPQVFTIQDDDGDVVTVTSFTNIAKNFTIQHDGKLYVCQEAIPVQQQQPNAQLNAVYDYILEEKSEKETMVLSDVKKKSYDSMVSFCGFKIKGGSWGTRSSLSALSDLPPFRWRLEIREDRPENRQLYMPYLRQNLSWPVGHVLVDCNESGHGYNSLLNTNQFDGRHSTSGNIDVVVAEAADADNHAIRQNIKAGIELKKTDNPGDHERQVVLQHFAASSLNPDFGILTMMTDLETRWHFYWFAAVGKHLYKLKTTRPEAAFLIEHMFDAPGTADASLRFPVDFLNRGTWHRFVSPTLEGIAESPSFDSGGDDAQGGVGDGDRGGNEGGGRGRSTYEDSEDSEETEGKGVMPSGPGNKYSAENANLLDHLEFADEEETREIVLGYIADNVVPLMVASPEKESSTKPNLVACPHSLFG